MTHASDNGVVIGSQEINDKPCQPLPASNSTYVHCTSFALLLFLLHFFSRASLFSYVALLTVFASWTSESTIRLLWKTKKQKRKKKKKEKKGKTNEQLVTGKLFYEFHRSRLLASVCKQEREKEREREREPNERWISRAFSPSNKKLEQCRRNYHRS